MDMFVYGIPGPDNCFPNPCQNEGACTNQNSSYECQCVSGYEGDECQTGEHEQQNQFDCIILDKYIISSCKQLLPSKLKMLIVS